MFFARFYADFTRCLAVTVTAL